MKKLIVWLLLGGMAFGELPEEPRPQGEVRVKQERFVEHRDRFWNKKFIVGTIALFGSSIYDAEVSARGVQHGRCQEAYGDPHSTRRQLYGRMLPIDGVVWGLAALMRKGRVPIAPYVMLGAGAGRHVYTGSLWFSEGCM